MTLMEAVPSLSSGKVSRICLRFDLSLQTHSVLDRVSDPFLKLIFIILFNFLIIYAIVPQFFCSLSSYYIRIVRIRGNK